MARCRGGQFERQSHGILDVGWRRGESSVQLLTDTVDARTGARWERGRVEVGARAAGFAAGLWITPQTAGRPDPSRAHLATYVGPDARIEGWLGRGVYVAATGAVRYHWFTPTAQTVAVVDDRSWTQADAIVGWWRPTAEARVSGGMDWTFASAEGHRVSPRLQALVDMRPEGIVAPTASARAVWAANADDVLATRVGGLTPYHVPMAGAAWAEYWVEDVVAGQIGAAVRPLAKTAPVALEIRAFMDAAVMTWPAATAVPSPPDRLGVTGFGLRNRNRARDVVRRDRGGGRAGVAVGIAVGIGLPAVRDDLATAAIPKGVTDGVTSHRGSPPDRRDRAWGQRTRTPVQTIKRTAGGRRGRIAG